MFYMTGLKLSRTHFLAAMENYVQKEKEKKRLLRTQHELSRLNSRNGVQLNAQSVNLDYKISALVFDNPDRRLFERGMVRLSKEIFFSVCFRT
jgi:hypothetical protein